MSNNFDLPVATQEAALRNAYRAGDPEHCASHHLNLSNQLQAAGREPQIYLAHRLAAGVLRFQAGSGALPDAVGALALSFVDYAPRRPPLPRTFDALCEIVEQVPGVQLRQMAETLAAGGGADGDEALHAVAGMAKYMAG